MKAGGAAIDNPTSDDFSSQEWNERKWWGSVESVSNASGLGSDQFLTVVFGDDSSSFFPP